MLEARNSKFHDFLVFQPVTGPQNQLYLSLERPGHLKKSRIDLGTSWEHIICVNLDMRNFETDPHSHIAT